METLIPGISAGGFVAVFLIIIISIVKNLLFICRPNEVLIFTGKTRQLADGTEIGFKVINAGSAMKIPFLEQVDKMDMSIMSVDVDVRNAYSKGGIPLMVQAIANVKISGDSSLIINAIERFLGKSRDEIRQVVKEMLEGNLRGILATLTPEEVNEDRLKFANSIVDEVDDDLAKLGLSLETLKIQNVADDSKYLDSIGRKKIAEVIRDAKIAESNSKREAEKVEALAKQAGEVAKAKADGVILKRQNELRKIKAELHALAQSEMERAEAAGKTAKAQAEQELQKIRTELEKIRLQSDVVIPAEARKIVKQLEAKGDAASIEESGKAFNKILEMMTQTWIKAGENAKDIFLLQQIESVMNKVVKSVQSIDVKDISILDNGNGKGLSNYVASYPAMVKAVFEELNGITGIDVPEILGKKSIINNSDQSFNETKKLDDNSLKSEKGVE